MGKGNFPLYAFNRGEVSRLALGRVDLDRLRLSAEEQVNWQPMVLGPMTLRPGLGYLGSTRSDLKAIMIPFVFGNGDRAAIELTGGKMRIWVPSDDASTSNAHAAAAGAVAVEAADEIVDAAEDGDLEVLTRPGVSTTVPNGEFATAGAWKLKASAGCSATITGDKLRLNAEGRGGTAACRQAFTVAPASKNREHAFKIVVDTGPVTFRAGSAQDAEDYVETTKLGEGAHSLAFTPTGGAIHILFETDQPADRIVDSCTIEAAGALTLDAPWTAGKLPLVRHAQSGDVVFLACEGVHPYKIERRGARSWSIVKYLSNNGPLKAVASEDMKMTPSAMYGNAILTADRPFFKPAHVGTLFRLFSSGQTNQAVLAAADTYTDPIRVTGTGHSRGFSFWPSGTWSGRLTLQRSTEDPDLNIGWADAKWPKQKHIATGNGRHKFLDSDDRESDNIIALYRVGFKPDDADGVRHYRGGAATVRFRDHDGDEVLGTGGKAGICRITGRISNTQVRIEIISPFSSLAPTRDWQEGEWSAASGYPSAVGFHDGRLWWAGGDKIWGSVSDDYTNFDIDAEGDSGPIQRSIGYGPVEAISWMLPLTRLILGREAAETTVRSSSLDEPITPTSFTLRDCSTKGSAKIGAIKCDARGLFVAKGGMKLYELGLDQGAGDFRAHDMTRLHPEVAGEGGFTRLCLQTQPDAAVHCVRADGQVAVLLYDKDDEVEAWWRVVTDGAVEDAFVLPGEVEDHVYYIVRRTIDGEIVRTLEKFARRDQCGGLPEARLADSHVVDTGGDKTITGLSHLNGKQVVAWGWNDNAGNGVDLGTFTVAGGKISIPAAYDKVCVGLPYAASFTSAKLAYAASQGSAVNQKKRVDHVGLILYDTHYQGLQYGQRADVLDNLPLVSEGAEVTANTVHAEFDEPMIEVPGEWDTDSRLVLKASSPRPCTVAAAVVGMQTHG